MVEALQGVTVTENYNSICAFVFQGKRIVFFFPEAAFLVPEPFIRLKIIENLKELLFMWIIMLVITIEINHIRD